MTDFLIGAIAMANLACGLFFLRFWRTTADRFFLLFAVSFFIESGNRVCLSFVDPASEHLPLFYLIRLAAFGLIFWAILDKNRARR